ncbi:hypothetical protein [Aquimarina sp. I32.4]|uniref:hypothetical protein n=1 Tax=Aquimarina sp. I32.4 TaxID=2053903 RepID=UPI000CDF2076|nr:hypothetical protein [Aquimarina sp. I32.4]
MNVILNKKVNPLKIVLLILIFNTVQFHAQECLCGKGALSAEEGEKPGFTAKFKNGEKLIICCGSNNHDGEDTFIESEFAVYDCLGDDLPISGYNAIKTCRISFTNDTLQIAELRRLAVGENWELKPIGYKTEFFYYVNDSLYRDEKITIPKFTISQKRIDEFYDFLENPTFDENITVYDRMRINYQTVKKLEILSVYGEEKALKLLKNYGGSYEEGFCCELAEAKMFALEMIDKISILDD